MTYNPDLDFNKNINIWLLKAGLITLDEFTNSLLLKNRFILVDEDGQKINSSLKPSKKYTIVNIKKNEPVFQIGPQSFYPSIDSLNQQREELKSQLISDLALLNVDKLPTKSLLQQHSGKLEKRHLSKNAQKVVASLTASQEVLMQALSSDQRQSNMLKNPNNNNHNRQKNYNNELGDFKNTNACLYYGTGLTTSSNNSSNSDQGQNDDSSEKKSQSSSDSSALATDPTTAVHTARKTQPTRKRDAKAIEKSLDYNGEVVKKVQKAEVDLAQFKCFNPKIHESTATPANPDYFWSPAQTTLIESNNDTIFKTLQDFKTFVQQVDEKFGTQNTHIITGGGTQKYVILGCKMKGCKYSQWYNFKAQKNTDQPGEIVRFRTINRSHSLEAHEAGVVKPSKSW